LISALSADNNQEIFNILGFDMLEIVKDAEKYTGKS